MMAPPVDVVGPRPRLGDVEAPTRSRSSLSSVAVAESAPLGRARRRLSAEARAESEPWGRAKRSPSSPGAEPKSEPWGRARRSSSSSRAEPEFEPWVRRGGVRRLPGLSPSPSPGLGGAEFAVFRAEPESEPWVGRSGVRRLPGPSPSPSPGSGEAEFPMTPEAGLGCCQPHSVGWLSSRSGAGGAVLLSDRSVERRSDCGHFDPVN
jgi:hypothetical protein